MKTFAQFALSEGSLQTVELRSRPDISRIVRAAFPQYRKRSAFVSEFGDRGKTINSYWDGGSRDVYALVNLSTMKTQPLPTASHPFFDVARAGMTGGDSEFVHVDHAGNITLKVLPPGFALVQGGTFMGKDATAHVYFPKGDQKALGAGGAPIDVTPERPALPAGDRVPVTGKTFLLRNKLKSLGGRWDADRKVWTVPADKAKEAQDFVDQFNRQ